MKYLFLLAILVVAYMAWRGGRLRESAPAAAPRTPARPALPQDMVCCPVCSVHLPRGEALAGASGRLYCSPDHRLAGGN
ncbi:MAG: PP0621 family protein [Ramlibacter sp.]